MSAALEGAGVSERPWWELGERGACRPHCFIIPSRPWGPHTLHCTSGCASEHTESSPKPKS